MPEHKKKSGFGQLPNSPSWAVCGSGTGCASTAKESRDPRLRLPAQGAESVHACWKTTFDSQQMQE